MGLNYSEIIQAFLMMTHTEWYRNKWLPDVVWVELIKDAYTTSNRAFNKLDKGKLNSAIARDITFCTSLDNHAVGNQWGIFHGKKKLHSGKKSKNVKCYIAVQPEEPLGSRLDGKVWWEGIHEHQNPVSVAGVKGSMPSANDESRKHPPSSPPCSPNAELPKEKATPWKGKNKKKHRTLTDVMMASYFEQKEAHNLFAPKSPLDEKVIMALNNQIKVLFEGTNKPDAWWGLINGGDEDNVLMPYQIECIKDHSRFILATLLYARENMGKWHQHWTFKKCCAMAVRDLNRIGLELTTNPKTLQKWHCMFACNGNKFPGPSSKSDKKPVPCFFEDDNDGLEWFCKYADSNLDWLNVDLMHEFCHEKLVNPHIHEYIWAKEKCNNSNNVMVLPVREGNDDDNDNKLQLPEEEIDEDFNQHKVEYLQQFGLKELCVDMVWCWMNDQGYQYSKWKKGYYNDKHEDEPNVLYRIDFIKHYKAYETHAYHWIQVSAAEANELIDAGKVLPKDGYCYMDSNGIDKVEFHVDSAELFHQRMNNNSHFPFGGNLSVRMPPGTKLLIIFGQDECIFKQYIFRRMHWVGCNGEVPLVPKDEGARLMISAFQSHEFGFSMELSAKDLAKVNAWHCGQKYKDEDAAETLYGKPEKQDLELTPFYWSLNMEQIWMGTGHMNTWWSSSKIARMFSWRSMETSMNMFFFLITHVDMTVSEVMGWMQRKSERLMVANNRWCMIPKSFRRKGFLESLITQQSWKLMIFSTWFLHQQMMGHFGWVSKNEKHHILMWLLEKRMLRKQGRSCMKSCSPSRSRLKKGQSWNVSRS